MARESLGAARAAIVPFPAAAARPRADAPEASPTDALLDMIEGFGGEVANSRAELHELLVGRAAGVALADAALDSARVRGRAVPFLRRPVVLGGSRAGGAPGSRARPRRSRSPLGGARAVAETARRAPEWDSRSATLEALFDTLAKRGHAVDDLRAELDYLHHMIASAERALAGAARNARLARASVMGRG